MKVEPAIDHPVLINRVASLYAIPAAGLVFVPEGECGVSYRVDCADGRRFFLKLWSDQRQARLLRQRLAVNLPLTRELFVQGLVTNLSYPIPTCTGSLSSEFGRYDLALFRYIDGRPAPGYSAEENSILHQQIAGTMARLHHAAPLLRSPLPQRSAFETGFAADLRRGLDALDNVRSYARPGLARLRELLLPRRKDLLHQLAAVENLAGPAQRNARTLVLCHTDMGGNNLLVDPDGQVYVLDWDELILAPPEHDLHEYRGPGFSAFLEMYFRAGGIRALDAHQFRFYLLRRYLADLTDWMIRIEEENSDPAQDANDLKGIKTYCLARLEQFEVEMAEIETALREAI